MNYQEITVDDPQYLYLRCDGSWDVESSQRLWQEIATRLAQSDHARVLLDERALELETSVSIDFDHASFVADLLRGISRRIAIVDSPENAESSRFFETVCVNRSLNLRFFLREEDAIDWLLS